MKLICCTAPLPPLHFTLPLLCRKDWTRHFNLFVLDMNLLASPLPPQSSNTRMWRYCHTHLGAHTLHPTWVSKQIFWQIRSSQTHMLTSDGFLPVLQSKATIWICDFILFSLLSALAAASAAVLFSINKSFIRACAWKIALLQLPPSSFYPSLFHTQAGNIAGF